MAIKFEIQPKIPIKFKERRRLRLLINHRPVDSIDHDAAAGTVNVVFSSPNPATPAKEYEYNYLTDTLTEI